MRLLNDIKSCTLCADVLPLGPKPILQFSRKSEILIVGQAPGVQAHESGIPWNDASGRRLRDWLQLPEQIFYDPKKTAIVPMGFCYPGKGSSGDLPPRPECRTLWLDTIVSSLHHIKIKIVIGNYAASYFCEKKNLSDLINNYATGTEPLIVLPHPSPRNNIWLAKNKWFEAKALPLIREKMSRAVTRPKV